MPDDTTAALLPCCIVTWKLFDNTPRYQTGIQLVHAGEGLSNVTQCKEAAAAGWYV